MVYDITSPNYVPKTYEDIFLEMLTRAYNTGLLSDDTHFVEYVEQTLDIESTFIMDLSNYSLMLSYVFSDLTKVHDENDIDKAVGYGLDSRLKLFVQRYLPSYSIGVVRFSINDVLPDDILIPPGTRVSTSGIRPVTFHTTESKTLIAGTLYIDVAVVCEEIGLVGDVPAHDIDNLEDEIAGIDAVDNELRFTGGADTEADDSYRSRGYLWKFSQRRGNYDAFVDALNPVAAIAGYNIERFWRGLGTTRIIIDPPTAPVLTIAENIVTTVEEVDEDIVVEGVSLVTIDVNMVVNVSIDQAIPVSSDKMVQIQADVNNSLITYIDGGINRDGTEREGMQIGQDFIPFQANAYIKTQVPEAQNFEVSFPTAPITIGNSEKGHAGTMTITVV